jgi:predicted small lipoprotein YifL
LSAAVLALGGCGRKGPLDLPPTASSQQQQSAAAAHSETDADQANKGSVFNPSFGADAPPTAGKGPKRPFIMDPLLNSN